MTTPKNTPPFNLNFLDDKRIGLTNQDTLRKLVGILGMLLPLLIWLYIWIDSSYGKPLESISHYYFTRAASIFCIIVSLLAIFLMVYKGKERIDFILSCTAGIFAFCVLLFPTNNITVCCDAEKYYSVTSIAENSARVNFHYISAAIFLLSLAALSFFVFTRSDKPVIERTNRKKMRNRIYRICAIVMLAAILFIFIVGYKGIGMPEEVYTANHLTFWMETVAIEAFGISWLVKGKAVLDDK